MPFQPQHERRRFFRLRYPLTDRPEFVLHGISYPLAEISEEGLRFFSPNTALFQPGFLVSGSVILRTSGAVFVEGRVLRIEGAEVIVHLQKGIPEQTIVSEQRYIISKYPRI